MAPELVASAAPSKEDVQSAKDQLASLNEHLSLLVEQYNQAKLQLGETKTQLAEARSVHADAQAQAEAVLRDLAGRASNAYMERGSQLGMLLGAASFSDFSDRLEFVGRLQQEDADIALAADAITQRAGWAAEELEKVQAQRSAVLERLRDRSRQIEQGIEQQQALVAELGERYQRAVDRREAARETAARRARADARRGGGADEGARQGEATSAGNDGDRGNGATGGNGGGDPGSENPGDGDAANGGTGGNGGGGNGGGGTGGGGGAGARAAISAAYSVIGTRYVWGGSTPRGFDCSGLTMWAWAHGGVSLAHSSAGQYAQLPHVGRGSLRPGDLVFFYRPIHHVGLYIGGGRMIDASHSGPGGEVAVRPVNWDSYVGAARP